MGFNCLDHCDGNDVFPVAEFGSAAADFAAGSCGFLSTAPGKML